MTPLLQNSSAAGVVTAAPRLILRAEGAGLLLAAVTAYANLGGDWVRFALLFLVPDLFMLGYCMGPRIGAAAYNFGHSTLLPLAVTAAGLFGAMPLTTGLGLVWLAHVGFDRLLGYGLKYSDAFRHTHLGTPDPLSTGA